MTSSTACCTETDKSAFYATVFWLERTAATAPARWPCARVLLAGEFRETAEPGAAAVLAACAAECMHLTLGVVADSPTPLCWWIGLSGVMTHDQVLRDAAARAEARARAIVRSAPEGINVSYMAAPSWRDLLRHASAGGYDVIALDELPSRWVDRRLARRAGWTLARPPAAGPPRLQAAPAAVS